jgi:hypothetical protein
VRYLTSVSSGGEDRVIEPTHAPERERPQKRREGRAPASSRPTAIASCLPPAPRSPRSCPGPRAVQCDRLVTTHREDDLRPRRPRLRQSAVRGLHSGMGFSTHADVTLTPTPAPEDCRIAIAAWKGYPSPSHRRRPLGSCATGGHRLLVDVQAATKPLPAAAVVLCSPSFSPESTLLAAFRGLEGDWPCHGTPTPWQGFPLDPSRYS